MPDSLSFGAATVLIFMSTAALGATVSVSDAWFRALPAGLPAGGYFSLHNRGAASVELVAAKSPACGMLMFHKSVVSGGVSRMQNVTSVTVPAGGSVAFAPGGYHLMCMNPGSAVSPGNHVPVTFVFADQDQVHADFVVKSVSGK